MPDITMCKGVNCPKKDKCFRYKAIPDNLRQSYFMDSPYDKEMKWCEHFVEILSTDRIKKDD